MDTNVVLDLFVFADQRVGAVEAAIRERRLTWIATAEMREELDRVLEYAHIQTRLVFYGIDREAVMASFDRFARIVDAPGKAPLTCSDRDDQKFIDLAVHHKCMLLSKDNAVLTMKRRLAALHVVAAATMPAC
ncbi:MAG: PIN domain-containing protein [Ramlibacter sp.]